MDGKHIGGGICEGATAEAWAAATEGVGEAGKVGGIPCGEPDVWAGVPVGWRGEGTNARADRKGGGVFVGLELLTYCILDNHFHLLVEVPGEVGELSDVGVDPKSGISLWRQGASGATVDAFDGGGGAGSGRGRRGSICGLVDAPDGEFANVCEGAEAAIFDWIQSAQ